MSEVGMSSAVCSHTGFSHPIRIWTKPDGSIGVEVHCGGCHASLPHLAEQVIVSDPAKAKREVPLPTKAQIDRMVDAMPTVMGDVTYRRVTAVGAQGMMVNDDAVHTGWLRAALYRAAGIEGEG